MNYILRESNDEKHLFLRADTNGMTIREPDVSSEIKMLEGAHFDGKICKDVWVCNDLSKLMEKAKELSEQFGLELKISRSICRCKRYIDEKIHSLRA